MTLYHTLRCVAFALTLVAMQRNARIDSDPILAFLCFASLCLITRKLLKYLLEIFAFHKLTQHKALRHIMNRPLYHIAGNFRMVQIFTVSRIDQPPRKMRTTNFSSASYVLLVGVVLPER